MLVCFRSRLFHLDGQPELVFNDGEVRLYLTGRVREGKAVDYLDGIWTASRHNTTLREDDGLVLRFIDRKTGKATFELVRGGVPLVLYSSAPDPSPTDQDKLQQVWAYVEKVNDFIASKDYLVFDEGGEVVPPNARFALDEGDIIFYTPEGYRVIYYSDEDRHRPISEILQEMFGEWKIVRKSDLQPVLEVIQQS